jgi:hypothetical protein
VRHKRGLSFVVIFPRQSGKNETQLSLYSYLLTHAQLTGGDIIHVEPTYKPQTITAMHRLEARLKSNALTRGKWHKKAGYIYGVGVRESSTSPATWPRCGRCHRWSAAVGQRSADINIQKFDKDFAPMGASTNCTRVFWGTRWTDDTLLEREYKSALAAQEVDHIQRVFFAAAQEVGASAGTISPLRQRRSKAPRAGTPAGQRSAILCGEPSPPGGHASTPARLMLMRGAHPERETPEDGKVYAFLVDVAGEDENPLTRCNWNNPARDSTALTIVEVDISGDRHCPHTALSTAVCGLARNTSAPLPN